MMEEFEAKSIGELKRCAWIYAKLTGNTRACIRLETGTKEGLENNHPNLGKWSCYVDIGEVTFCGTVESCLMNIRDGAKKLLGPGYL